METLYMYLRIPGVQKTPGWKCKFDNCLIIGSIKSHKIFEVSKGMSGDRQGKRFKD